MYVLERIEVTGRATMPDGILMAAVLFGAALLCGAVAGASLLLERKKGKGEDL